MTVKQSRPMVDLTPYEEGLVVAILVGEGSFTGDGKNPHVALRMHVRHKAMFEWLVVRFPRSRLYGPYNHGGRRYYQWMIRGAALVEDLLPILEARMDPNFDQYSFDRLQLMLTRYADVVERLQGERP